MEIRVTSRGLRFFMRSAALCALTLSLVAWLPSEAQSKATKNETLTAEEALKKARTLYGTGDFEGSLQWLEYANNKEPKAIIVYNIGRVQEKLGRLADAHNTFLRVTALSDVDEKIRGLSQAQAEKLKPFIDKTVLHFPKLKAGSMVQVDEKMILDLTVDAEIKPGSHQICVLDPTGKNLSCWRRKLAAGIRIPWPPKTASTTRGTLVWKGVKGASELYMNGHPLLVDLSRLENIKVDVGRHELIMADTNGKKKKATVAVLSRGKKKLRAAFKNPSSASKGSAGTAGRSKNQSGPTNIWPWVVTGTGVVLGGAGASFMAKSSTTRDDWDRKGCIATSTCQKAKEDAFNAANSEAQMGYILAGAGALTIAGGITWWILDKKSSKKTQASNESEPTFWFGFDGIRTLSVSGRF